MKKILVTIMVAIIGGIISLGIYKLIEKDNIERNVLQPEQTPIMTVRNSTNEIAIGPDFTHAAESSIHAVVYIKTEFVRKSNIYDDYFNLYEFFRGKQGYHTPILASGSGVIISSGGYIVTNNHVVQEADKITVTLNDKRTYDAVIVGTDPSTDLALLKIDKKGLPYIQYGNSDDVRIGEWVLAVGNPFNLTSTVTAGIVSAKARNINILGENSSYSAIESYIQTDAAVNKGNSGGALVNTLGKLIGINAAIATSTGSYEGYSFAIPVNIVKKVMEDLLNYGEVQRALLGVSIRDIDSELALEMNLDELKGVYIAAISDYGAAKKAGINEGDVIVNIDKKEINSTSELLGVIGQMRPGDKINVTVKRNGKLEIFNVVLKNIEGNTEIIKKENKIILTKLGASFEQLTSHDLKKLGITNGVQIVSLKEGKLKNAGIKSGFIITKINKKGIFTVEDINNILKNKVGGVLMEGLYPNGIRAYYGVGM